MRNDRLPKIPKVQYTEDEAAQLLGVSVEQLRSLVTDHIVRDDADVLGVTLTTYHPSDLVMLRILALQLRCPNLLRRNTISLPGGT